MRTGQKWWLFYEWSIFEHVRFFLTQTLNRHQINDPDLNIVNRNFLVKWSGYKIQSRSFNFDPNLESCINLLKIKKYQILKATNILIQKSTLELIFIFICQPSK